MPSRGSNLRYPIFNNPVSFNKRLIKFWVWVGRLTLMSTEENEVHKCLHESRSSSKATANAIVLGQPPWHQGSLISELNAFVLLEWVLEQVSITPVLCLRGEIG